MIRFEDVSFRYPAASSPALEKINLEIDQGEYVLIAGPSGSGKSSLLRCMNGLIPHFYGGIFGGRICLDGFDTRESLVRKLSGRVGLVFQDPENQFITTSVRSEIAFGQENLGQEPCEVERRTSELGKGFGLEELLDRPPSEISGGEMQKTIIASVAAMGTRILALDEPTSQLDPSSASQIFQLLKDLNGEGMTIVLTEHRLRRALRDVSRALVMDSGRVVLDGKPRDLMRSFPQLVSLPKPEERVKCGQRSFKVKIRDLSFRYSEETDWVIRNLSLGIAGSELLGVVGANGAGKSTLGRIMTGILGRYEGEVLLDGQEIRTIPMSILSKKVGIVFQNPNKHLFHDTVAEEVDFARKNMGIQSGPDVYAILDQFGLKEFASRNPRDLSGGQKEKVAIASVMGYGPEVLILDEPTRGLDLPEKAGIMGMLRTLTREKGITVLVFTHDLEIVEGFADRAAVISGGRISFEGDPHKAVRRFSEG